MTYCPGPPPLVGAAPSVLISFEVGLDVCILPIVQGRSKKKFIKIHYEKITWQKLLIFAAATAKSVWILPDLKQFSLGIIKFLFNKW